MDYEPLSDDDAEPGARTITLDGVAVDPDSLDWDDVRKRPVQVEAVQIDAPVMVETMEGTMEAPAGAYLIRGVEGEVYPCDADVFAQTYMTTNDGTRDRTLLDRAAIATDEATTSPPAKRDRYAVQALLELADYVGADVHLPGDDPGGEPDDGGGD